MRSIKIFKIYIHTITNSNTSKIKSFNFFFKKKTKNFNLRNYIGKIRKNNDYLLEQDDEGATLAILVVNHVGIKRWALSTGRGTGLVGVVCVAVVVGVDQRFIR
jgi:hypothetical protein